MAPGVEGRALCYSLFLKENRHLRNLGWQQHPAGKYILLLAFR